MRRYFEFVGSSSQGQTVLVVFLASGGRRKHTNAQQRILVLYKTKDASGRVAHLRLNLVVDEIIIQGGVAENFDELDRDPKILQVDTLDIRLL